MQLRDLFIGIGLMCLWGFNFSVIKLGVDQIDPILLTAGRFTLAAIPAVFFVPRPKVALKFLIAYGLSFGVGVWGLMTLAIDLGISAGMAGLLLQMSVVSSLFLGWWYLKEAINLAKVLGVALALMGLGLTLTLEDGSVTVLGVALVMLAAVCWSVNGIIVKRANTTEIFSFCVWGMLFAPLPLLVIAGISRGPQVFYLLTEQMNGAAAFSILFQAYPTTLLGYWVWNRLLVKYPLSSVAPLTFLVPVFGLLGSVLFYQEGVDTTKLMACTFIVAGLLVSQLRNLRLPFSARLSSLKS